MVEKSRLDPAAALASERLSLSQYLLLGAETVREGLSCRQKGVSVGLRGGVGCVGMGRGEELHIGLPL